jgi:hypothetical protein
MGREDEWIRGEPEEDSWPDSDSLHDDRPDGEPSAGRGDGKGGTRSRAITGFPQVGVTGA